VAKFLAGQLEHEIHREAVQIAFDRLQENTTGTEVGISRLQLLSWFMRDAQHPESRNGACELARYLPLACAGSRLEL
jgi:hypothetical protein